MDEVLAAIQNSRCHPQSYRSSSWHKLSRTIGSENLEMTVLHTDPNVARVYPEVYALNCGFERIGG